MRGQNILVSVSVAVTTQNRAMCGAHALATQAGRGMETASAALRRQSAAISRDRDEHTPEGGGPGLLVCSAVWQGSALECVRLRKQKQIDKQTMQPLPHAAWTGPRGRRKRRIVLSNLKMIKAGW